MPSNRSYNNSGNPVRGGDGSSADIRAEFAAIAAGCAELEGELNLKSMGGDKDASNGYPGLTLFKINFKNTLNTFISFFTNANTAIRTYTFQDRDGTIADNTDLALKAPKDSPSFTGIVNGITKAMVGLNTADNTADNTKNVFSATKLTTPRTINGVSFDGTGNISVPSISDSILLAAFLPILVNTSGGNIVKTLPTAVIHADYIQTTDDGNEVSFITSDGSTFAESGLTLNGLNQRMVFDKVGTVWYRK